MVNEGTGELGGLEELNEPKKKIVWMGNGPIPAEAARCCT